MKKTVVGYGICCLLIVTTIDLKLPNGWIRAGDSPDKYEMGIDSSNHQEGKKCATIKSICLQPTILIVGT